MAISSNSVFHFTSGIRNLNSILKGEFKITYCFEVIDMKNTKYGAGMPMVSFCDIPLSQINRHIKHYGSFGIGLSKEWAIKNGLNPVLYLQSQSKNAELIEPFLKGQMKGNKFLKRFQLIKKGSKSIVVDIFKGERKANADAFKGLFMYLKNYEGEPFRNAAPSGSTIRFYNEREWRYVPNEADFPDNIAYEPLITQDEYKTWRSRSKKKLYFPDMALTFTAQDVCCLLYTSRCV